MVLNNDYIARLSNAIGELERARIEVWSTGQPEVKDIDHVITLLARLQADHLNDYLRYAEE